MGYWHPTRPADTGMLQEGEAEAKRPEGFLQDSLNPLLLILVSCVQEGKGDGGLQQDVQLQG